jgi:hypothetical protein
LEAGCGGRGGCEDERGVAYGEIVWFWRSEAGAKSAMMLSHHADDGGNPAMVTEESTYKS